MVCNEKSRQQLRDWLNKRVKVQITDGRVLIGKFVCTDKDANIIIGQCDEYLPKGYPQQSRNLGLAMVPGKHIISIGIQDHNEEDIS